MKFKQLGPNGLGAQFAFFLGEGIGVDDGVGAVVGQEAFGKHHVTGVDVAWELNATVLKHFDPVHELNVIDLVLDLGVGLERIASEFLKQRQLGLGQMALDAVAFFDDQAVNETQSRALNVGELQNLVDRKEHLHEGAAIVFKIFVVTRLKRQALRVQSKLARDIEVGKLKNVVNNWGGGLVGILVFVLKTLILKMGEFWKPQGSQFILNQNNVFFKIQYGVETNLSDGQDHGVGFDGHDHGELFWVWWRVFSRGSFEVAATACILCL